ncbi:MAG: ATP-grasp domain-containing protein [Deltaproteobacteria bacterium]|nr:MAG: ATP-grasp domain-containing protein [Deltaproteobacteria bacterium]
MSQIIRNRISPRYFQRDPILFNNIKLEPDKAYFFYIGDIKNHGLNAFLIPYLERIYGRPVDCIALVPDVLAHYGYPNLAVLNKESYRYHADKGMMVNCRPTAGQFAQQISASLLAQELLENILSEQDFVYIYMFESRPEMTLVDGERVKLLGPDPSVAHRFNNKIIQYQMACEVGIPVPEGLCCNCLEEALDSAQKFFRSGEEVFVSESYSAAGSNSTFACSCEEIQQRFIETDQPYLVTRRVPHSYDPTVLAVVANEQEVYVASVADQRMEENRFRGSTFPTVLKEEVVKQIKEYTRLVGRYMGSQGYRGMFGCDYIVNDNGQIYFVEVNARKQGTTLESTLTMLYSLPGHPSLSEIEFCAITRGRLPHGLTEMDPTRSEICWGTYNVKSMQDIRVVQKFPYFQGEAEIFRQVSQAKGVSSRAIVEDHLGPGVYQRAGGFVGRCISVGKNFAEMYRQLEKRETQVKASFRPWHH